jgi:TolB-like protein
MSGIIPGYEYDIFISYRQKDNKGDKWVSEFVEALKTELESTFKEEITVYFDINPHDGLLETHDVDASLKEKLRCLIFIPVISQTYCDPKSFAWQHELCVFNKFAKEDKFGRDIRLAGGNVSSRILPVKIHDLEPEDNSLLENELGRVLRSIEFIYKSAGVNRPLRANEDHPQDNINKTYFRDQINKVANSVKEIISSIKKYNKLNGNVPKVDVNKIPERQRKLKPEIIIAFVIVVALMIPGYFLFSKIFKSTGLTPKSIAVLPFKLLSNESDKQYLADGMMNDIILHLTKIKDLRVIPGTSVEQYRGTTKSARIIGKELRVDYLLEGSFQKNGDKVKLIVQLILASEESHEWADEYNRDWKDVFSVQSEVAQAIAGELHAVITPEEKQLIETTSTGNMQAYDAFLRGRSLYEKDYRSEFNAKAAFWFLEAIKLDSTYALPLTYLSMLYWRNSNSANFPGFKKAKQLAQKALDLNPNSGPALVNFAEILDNEYNFNGAEEKIIEALKMEPNNPYVLRNAGRFYTKFGREKESISLCLRALELDASDSTAFRYLMLAYYCSGRFREALEKMKDIKELSFNNFIDLRFQIYLAEGNLDKIFSEQDAIKDENIKDFILAAAHFKQGNNVMAEKIMSELKSKFSYPYLFAQAYAYGDDKEKVYFWLEKSYAAKEIVFTYVGVDPAFKNLRNEPKMKDLVKRLTSPMKEVPGNFYPDSLAIEKIPRNRFDGVYKVTGTFRDYVNPEWEGFYPKIIHLITASAYSVDKYDAEYDTYNYFFDAMDRITSYSNWKPCFVFDESGNVINIVNSLEDPAPRSRTAVLFKGKGAVNKFNESDHSIDVSYQLKQMNVTPNLRNLIVEHYKYIGPRQTKLRRTN